MGKNQYVTIIGCGVIGLSCGITLLENGFKGAIIARDLPLHTVSNHAGAVWFPFKAAPRDLLVRWSAQAHRVFSQLAQDPASGVHLTTLVVLDDPSASPHPWWADALPPGGCRAVRPEELPPGYVQGFALQAPLIQPNKYLNFLMDRFLSRGGTIRQEEVQSLSDLDQPVLVNCTGLGARQVVPDPDVFPISGHIALVQATRPVRCLLDEHGKNALAYVFPRPDVCVLGGTAVDHDWNETPDPHTIQSILSRCRALEPGLADAQLVDSYVGLRPGRRVIRCEAEQVDPHRLVFHNYGHGGSGFTVSWGCAQELVQVLS